MAVRKDRQSAVWRPHDSWGGLVITAGARIKELSREGLSRAGLSHLSHGRIGVLSLLLAGPFTQAELCRTLGQKPPSMMEMLARLAKEGLVVSAPDPTDHRKVQWSLSERGRRDIVLARAAFRKSGNRIDRFFSKRGVVASEIERTKEILRLFLKNT